MNPGAIPYSLLVQILELAFGPSIYDVPEFGGGGPLRSRVFQRFGPHPEPWVIAGLNPQPLPPKALYALMLADAHVAELMRVDSLVADLGEGAVEQGSSRLQGLMTEIEELCPRPFPWPKRWPVPPGPLPDEDFGSVELAIVGSRFAMAAERLESGSLKDAADSVSRTMFNAAAQG
jgi:hypothetical protein